MQISMKYSCRKTIRDKTLHVWNSACIVNNYLLRHCQQLSSASRRKTAAAELPNYA